MGLGALSRGARRLLPLYAFGVFLVRSLVNVGTIGIILILLSLVF